MRRENAGTFATVMLMVLAQPLVKIALSFGPTEYFSMLILALCTLGGLMGESVIKGLLMAAFGIFLGTVGIDPVTGVDRFTFGVPDFMDGIGFLPVAIGLFAIAEVLLTAEVEMMRPVVDKVKGLLPSLKDWVDSKWAIARGTVIGFLIGCMPGGGATLASVVSYLVEKKFSRHPEKFGKGAIEIRAFLLVDAASKSLLVDPRHTSQTCGSCGATDRRSRKSQPRFVCTFCGHRDNADRNAAVVILNRGNTVGVEPCRWAGDKARTVQDNHLEIFVL